MVRTSKYQLSYGRVLRGIVQQEIAAFNAARPERVRPVISARDAWEVLAEEMAPCLRELERYLELAVVALRSPYAKGRGRRAAPGP